MAGDLPLQEELILSGDPGSPLAAAAPGAPAASGAQGRILHAYGKHVRIMDLGRQAGGAHAAAPLAPMAPQGAPVGLTEIEQLGVAAFQLRQSPGYVQAKQNRPRQGDMWDFPIDSHPRPSGAVEVGAEAPVGSPTSDYLEGSIAVGIVMVSGSTDALRLSEAERTKIVAEVQNGLSFYATTNRTAGLTFVYDIQHVKVTAAAGPSGGDYEAMEAPWRDAAMAALGFSGSWTGVEQYVEQIRQNLGTRWTYCAFFTKYPLHHFAYASRPRLVMHYDNGDWGPDNIDRVFAHETGHIFGAPDEYASSDCGCGGAFGRWGKPNLNCANCAPGGGDSCIMKKNDWTMCPYTPAHVGWMAGRMFAKHSHLALDIMSGSKESGVPAIQEPYYGGEHQFIRPDHISDGYYRLVAQHSGKVLDVASASLANGAQVNQYHWKGGDNQLFRLEPLGDGYVRIIAKHSGKVLDVANASLASGAQIVQYDWHGGDNQRWLITAPITSKSSGKVLDVAGSSTDSGAEIIQWDYNRGGNQIFRPEALGGGEYRLIAHHSGKVLDVANASLANGAQVNQYHWKGGDNQRFFLEFLSDGHVRIVAKHSGKVLDVANASLASGAQIVQYDWHGGDNQRWLLPTWP